MKLLTNVETTKLGLNHPTIGLVGLQLDEGEYHDVVVRPEGDVLRLEHGTDTKEGTLFVGKSYYNHKFLTVIPAQKIEPSGWEEKGMTREELAKRYNIPLIPLPEATMPLWQVADSAGCAEVAYWAVRLVGNQKAYVQDSGYKGRRDWKVRILSSDGTVETVTIAELRGRLAPQPTL